jgi:phosphoenolpyruvate phosphomutase
VSAARCLPDASILTMTEYVQAAWHMQSRVGIPVVADVDTGYGNNLNIAQMVQEYERAGITAVCMEDKLFPKMNSFVGENQQLLDADAFASKIQTAVSMRASVEFIIIARTEALIAGLGADEALRRSHLYIDAGASAILVHSKAPTNVEVLGFLSRWDSYAPVVVVPTTYPAWSASEAARDGVSVMIYANQGLRATVRALRDTYASIIKEGGTQEVEGKIASIKQIFALQDLVDWQALESS